MSDADDIHRIPINDIHQQDGAHELATLPEFGAIHEFCNGAPTGNRSTPELEAFGSCR